MRWEGSRPVVQQTIRNKGGNSPGRISTEAEARGFKNGPYSENKTFLTWLSRCGHFLGSSLQVLTTFPEGAMLDWVPTSRKADLSNHRGYGLVSIYLKKGSRKPSEEIPT